MKKFSKEYLVNIWYSWDQNGNILLEVADLVAAVVQLDCSGVFMLQLAVLAQYNCYAVFLLQIEDLF